MHKLGSLNDIELLEAIPYEQRLTGMSSSYDLFRQTALHSPDATALVFLPHGAIDDTALFISYAELYANITRAANVFYSLGIGSSDVVSYMLPNLPQTHYTLWGAQAAGIVNAINPLLEVEQLVSLLNEVSCKVLVTLGPSAGTEMWNKVLALRGRVHSLQAVLLVQESKHIEGMHSFDIELHKQPADSI